MLILWKNNITDNGVYILGKQIEQLNKLTNLSLVLELNKITDKGLNFISNSLVYLVEL